MSYKTLLALKPVDDPAASLKPVAAFAHSLGAHVDAVVLDLVALIPTMTFMQDPNCEWVDSLPQQLKRIEGNADEVSNYFQQQGVTASASGEAQQLGLIGKAVASAAISSDLVVVVPSSEDALLHGILGHAIEGALFKAGRPVLVLGQSSQVQADQFENVVVAWDGGREATRAVDAAMPLLKSAKSVALTVVEENSDSDLAKSAQRFCTYLQRHDIPARFECVAPEGRSVGHAIVDSVNSGAPDLVVMGAYGHSRLRERLFSGVTRTALRDLQVPLFIAH